MSSASRSVSVQRFAARRAPSTEDDLVAVEEPLEISVAHGHASDRQVSVVSVTMRTPGQDDELATGLLIAEGVIRRPADVLRVQSLDTGRVRVELAPTVPFAPDALARRGYTSSACGICGKIAFDTGETLCGPPLSTSGPRLAPATISALGDTVRHAQVGFDATGGLHAAALFTGSGDLIALREDVGRHNALDKLIGAQFLAGTFPLQNHVLFLSGRVSFELVQKALMAGIGFVAAVGAPSSYAVELAEENDITLLGFVRGERFNVYAGAWRVNHTTLIG